MSLSITPWAGTSKGTGSFASLQASSGGTEDAKPVSVAGINDIKMPEWMSTNPDDNIGELLKAYSGIQAAFDPTQQVKARNNAIAYNTTAGGQAANNAATEYANRAAQSGTSSLGAGVVKAQALLPVFAQNAALKTDAADVAAKAHREGATLASQIASTIGDFRMKYLTALTGYAEGQQRLQLGADQFNSNLALDKSKLDFEMKKSDEDQRRLAAMGLLGAPGPSGNYVTDSMGTVTQGGDFYDRLKTWGESRDAATSALRGML